MCIFIKCIVEDHQFADSLRKFFDFQKRSVKKRLRVSSHRVRSTAHSVDNFAPCSQTLVTLRTRQKFRTRAQTVCTVCLPGKTVVICQIRQSTFLSFWEGEGLSLSQSCLMKFVGAGPTHTPRTEILGDATWDQMWGDKCGEPLTLQLREINVEGDPDHQRSEALVSHRG